VSEATVSPWLTIVTVVKDDAAGFERTMTSIGQQDLDGVEWVIIDSSTDTNALPTLLASEAAPTSHYAWTEPRGIYPAMNDGLARATGTYIYFLNAGDELASPTVAADMRRIAQDEPVWFYGQVRFVDVQGGSVTPPPFDYDKERAAAFSRGRFPPHQGTVARTEVLRAMGGFDTSFKIAADYAMILRLSTAAAPAETRETLATFYEGGLSSTAWKQARAEFHRARMEILPMTTRDRLTEGIYSARQRAAMSLVRFRHR
jgi:glycosyltransferase involved in cell wall biosynthesis